MKPQEPHRTFEEYPFKDISEKMIPCVPVYRESFFVAEARSIRNIFEETIEVEPKL